MKLFFPRTKNLKSIEAESNKKIINRQYVSSNKILNFIIRLQKVTSEGLKVLLKLCLDKLQKAAFISQVRLFPNHVNKSLLSFMLVGCSLVAQHCSFLFKGMWLMLFRRRRFVQVFHVVLYGRRDVYLSVETNEILVYRETKSVRMSKRKSEWVNIKFIEWRDKGRFLMFANGV